MVLGNNSNRRSITIGYRRTPETNPHTIVTQSTAHSATTLGSSQRSMSPVSASSQVTSTLIPVPTLTPVPSLNPFSLSPPLYLFPKLGSQEPSCFSLADTVPTTTSVISTTARVSTPTLTPTPTLTLTPTPTPITTAVVTTNRPQGQPAVLPQAPPGLPMPTHLPPSTTTAIVPTLTPKQKEIKDMLDDLYFGFQSLCSQNQGVKFKTLLAFYFVHVNTMFHIYKKWSKTFIQDKIYAPDRYKNESLIFEVPWLQNCVYSTIIFKLWENYTYYEFEKKLILLTKVTDKIKKYLIVNDNGKKLFTRNVEIGIWYENICEYFVEHLTNCTNFNYTNKGGYFSESILTTFKVPSCTIKLLLKYNKALSYHDVHVLIRTMIFTKTQYSIYVRALHCHASKSTNAEKNSYMNMILILISSCHSLIDNSNVSFSSITDEMMRFIICSVKSNIEQLSDLIYYYEDKKELSKNEVIALVHKTLVKSLHVSVIYLLIIKKCIKSEETEERANKLKLKLKEEFGIMCRDLILELIEKYNVYTKKNVTTRMHLIEKIINSLTKEMLLILKDDFGVETKVETNNTEKSENPTQIFLSVTGDKSKLTLDSTTHSHSSPSSSNVAPVVTTSNYLNQKYVTPYWTCNYEKNW